MNSEQLLLIIARLEGKNQTLEDLLLQAHQRIQELESMVESKKEE